MEAEAAAKKYEELTGIGGYYPKDPALLSWRRAGLARAPGLPRPGAVDEDRRVHAEDAAHVRARRVSRRASARWGPTRMAALLRVSAVHPEDSISVNDVVPAAGAGGDDQRARGEARHDRAPPARCAVDRHGARVGADRGRASTSCAPGSRRRRTSRRRPSARTSSCCSTARARITTLPPGSSAVRAYLGHMTGATVDFLTFDREVRAPIGRSLPVATALAKLAAFAARAAERQSPRRRARSRRRDPPGERGDRASRGRRDRHAHAERADAGQGRRDVVEERRARARRGRRGRRRRASRATTIRRGRGCRGAPAACSGTPARRGTSIPTRAARSRSGRGRSASTSSSSAASPGNFVAPDVLEEGAGIDHFAIADAATSRVDLTGELWSTADPRLDDAQRRAGQARRPRSSSARTSGASSPSRSR